VYNYYATNGRTQSIPAEIKRKALEVSLIEAYHWTPNQINEIPYSKLQELLIILETKNDQREHDRSVEKTKNEIKSGKMTREV
jgi:hypothetical protein